MPMMEVNLEQLLKVVEKLNPAEIAILQERIHLAQHSASVKTSTETSQRDEFFTLPFKEYLALSDEKRERIQLSVYQSKKKWIDAELERRKAEWILVCGGEVVECSETLRNYPSREKLMALGEERGVVPFVFVKAPLIEEESAWAALPHADFYPTLSIIIGTAECAAEKLVESGIACLADFDSGSPHLFLNYDMLLSHDIIDRQLIDQAHFREHLGQLYQFHILFVVIGVTDERGVPIVQEFPALCVRNWQRSPLCTVNPHRAALVGRNLLLELPLRLELNGRRRITRVLADENIE